MSVFTDVLAYIVAIAIPMGGGALSGLAMDRSDTWYDDQKQAPWTPPGAAFAIVWPILYFLMGTASFIVWKNRAKQSALVKAALIAYLVQLALNLIWPPILFKAHSLLWALIVIILVDVAAIFCNMLFGQVSKIAAILFIPYPIWVLYATSLAVYLYIKN